nr:tryptophan-rich sensory protein [Brevibacterium daeguense]
MTVVAVALSIVAAFFGSGALGGTPITEAAGGWLTADSTPVAPAGPAFSIWSVIYAGLIGYALWQLLPAARASERQRRLRPWAILSAVLNAAWIWLVQLGVLVLTVVVILALLAVLIRILVIMTAERPAGWAETVLTDGTFGLYLGWVCVATAANIAAWLASLGLAGIAGWQVLGCAVVLVAAAIAVATAVWTRGRIAPALATTWGLAWVAVGRLDGGLISPLVAWCAALASVAVIAVAVIVRLRAGVMDGGNRPVPARDTR